MYRKNKYGESIEVNKYECGSCANYEFDREDQSNYCKHYCHYYYYSDSCNNWSMASDVSGGGGCFLTTACCEYMGLPDDCEELQCLRSFRDNVLLNNVEGRALVKEYYRIAPNIVDKLNAHIKKDILMEEIYASILKIVDLIKNGDYEMATVKYSEMVLGLKDRI